MYKNKHLLIAVAMTSVFASGCNVGMAPSGMSRDEAKAAIDALPPAQKIRGIASSPMPAAEKQKRYEQIERETGVKASDVLGGAVQPPGAGTPVSGTQ